MTMTKKPMLNPTISSATRKTFLFLAPNPWDGVPAVRAASIQTRPRVTDAEDVVPHAAGGKLFEASADPSASKDTVIDGGAVCMSPADEHACSDQMIT